MKNSFKNRALEGTRNGDVVGGLYRGPGKTFGRFCFEAKRRNVMDWDKRMKLDKLLERAKCDRERALILANSLDDQDVKIVLLYLHNAVAGAEKATP